MQRINTIGIMSKPGVPRARTLVPEIIGWLQSHQIDVRVDPQTAEYAEKKDALPRDQVPA